MQDNEDVSIANFAPACLFRQIEIYFNSCQVADLSSPSYPWKHHIENLLSYSDACKNTFLRAEMFNKQDSIRKSWISNSKSCNFSLKPNIDIFNSEKFLPPNVSFLY